MSLEQDLRMWLALWLVAAAYTLVRHWRTGRGAGLVFAYVVSLGAIHWLAAAIFVLPWYVAPGLDSTVDGLRVAAIGLIAFAVGGEIGAAVFQRATDDAPVPESGAPADARIVNLYVGAGALFYSVIFPLVSALPTVAALASTASSLMVLGVALKSWNAWQQGRPLGAWAWLASTIGFPFVTLVGQGFLGFGFAAMLIVAAFVASFYRPRWHVVAVAVVVAYAGLSIYVTYMRDRRDIRAVVWGGEAMGSRVNRLAETFRDMEWFDVNDLEHLRRVDERLNQDALVGLAVNRVETGSVSLAYGETIRAAALSLVPRAIWPSKPIVAGSGDIVSDYTGILFAEGTSVGVGHVMEWYINFGDWGVAAGFLLMGAVLVYLDRSAGMWLHRGDASRLSLWFLPGLALLQVGGSFVEMASGAAAAWVVAWLLSRLLARYLRPAEAWPLAPGTEDRA